MEIASTVAIIARHDFPDPWYILRFCFLFVVFPVS